MRDSRSEATSTGHKRNRQALKNRSNSITAEPAMTAAAVSNIGRNRTAPASMTAAASGPALLHSELDEIDDHDQFLTTIPRPL